MTEASPALRALVYGLLTVIGVIMVFPVVWMVLTALKTPAEILTVPPVLFPDVPQWGNFAEAWAQGPFNRFFLNSALISAGTTALVLTVSTLAGFAFAKLRFGGAGLLFLLVISTMMIPEQVTVIPVFIFLRDVGLIDTRLGVILPMAASGFGTFLMRQFILSVPNSLIDAARLDGCGDLQILWFVVLPLVRPALAALAIFTFLGSWDAFLWPLILLSSEANATLPLGLARFNEEYVQQPHYTMAVATISVAPVILAFLLAQRTFIRGATLSGLK